MDNENKSMLLSDYIRSLDGFTIVDYFDGNYNHMGATISDAILQAGTKYETVVRPRIERILEIYAEAVTTTAFWLLLEEKGPKTILRWNDDEKPNRVLAFTKFLLEEGIETEKELNGWIANESNETRLLKLRGVGRKTVDYIKILVGLQTVAVDQHLYAFLREAGIGARSYEEARDILNHTAGIMKIERVLLDHSIWRYMSNRKKRQFNRLPCKKEVDNFWHKECIKIKDGNAKRQHHCHHPGRGAGDPHEIQPPQGVAPDPGAAHDRLSAGYP